MSLRQASASNTQYNTKNINEFCGPHFPRLYMISTFHCFAKGAITCMYTLLHPTAGVSSSLRQVQVPPSDTAASIVFGVVHPAVQACFHTHPFSHPPVHTQVLFLVHTTTTRAFSVEYYTAHLKAVSIRRVVNDGHLGQISTQHI